MSAPGPNRRRRPRPEVPTAVQLGLRPRTMMLRGLFRRCPVCGERHLFRRWFTMVDRCPTCSLRFERVEGHWIGAIGVNTVCVMGLMLIVLATVTFSFFPESPPISPLLVSQIVIAGLGPLVFFPSSKTVWSAMDLLMRPLAPGEVDPRFVEVDPLRDGSNTGPRKSAPRDSDRPRRRPQRSRDPRGGPTPPGTNS